MLIAQTGVSSALDTLNNSLELSQNTQQSWNTVWSGAIYSSSTSGFWIALVGLGLTLAAFSLVYVALTEGKEIFERQAWSQLVSLFIWPLIIAFFLGNNGALLARSVQFIHSFGLSQIEQVQQTQIAQLTFQEAVQSISVTNAARQQIESILSECAGKQGPQLPECLRTNQPIVEEILSEARQLNNGQEPESLRNWIDGLFGAVDYYTSGEFSADVFRATINFILSSVQWAFINILEAALLLTAAFSPIAMGLSLLPFQGRPIIAWLIGFISLLGVQLGYTIVVGLAAVVIVNSNAELITDVAFLFFLAIFAPILAIAVSGYGGLSVYRSITSGTKQITDLLSAGLSSSVQGLRQGYR